VIDGALALIVETVAQGGDVEFHGFGKFRPVARTLRPFPAFAPGKHFLEALAKSLGSPPQLER
jgi:nucleoid DNA-binding protein